MHIGDMLWAISEKYLDILSPLVIFLSELWTLCVTLTTIFRHVT
jgi:hypothetical protein